MEWAGSAELADVVNENTGYPIKFEFQDFSINKYFQWNINEQNYSLSEMQII